MSNVWGSGSQGRRQSYKSRQGGYQIAEGIIKKSILEGGRARTTRMLVKALILCGISDLTYRKCCAFKANPLFERQYQPGL